MLYHYYDLFGQFLLLFYFSGMNDLVGENDWGRFVVLLVRYDMVMSVELLVFLPDYYISKVVGVKRKDSN